MTSNKIWLFKIWNYCLKFGTSFHHIRKCTLDVKIDLIQIERSSINSKNLKQILINLPKRGGNVVVRQNRDQPEYTASPGPFSQSLKTRDSPDRDCQKLVFARSLGVRQLFSYFYNFKLVGLRQISFYGP